jgi:hypothetical protein
LSTGALILAVAGVVAIVALALVVWSARSRTMGRESRDVDRSTRQLQAAQALTMAYRKVLQTPRDHFWPLSALPADKETLKVALRMDAAFQASRGVIDEPVQNGNAKVSLRETYISTYAMLADFVPDDLAARVNPYWSFIKAEGKKVESGEPMDATAAAHALMKLAPSEDDRRASQSALDESGRLSHEMRAYLDRIAPRKAP